MADRITEILEQFAEARKKMVEELGKVIIGQQDVIDQIFAARLHTWPLFAGGCARPR